VEKGVPKGFRIIDLKVKNDYKVIRQKCKFIFHHLLIKKKRIDSIYQSWQFWS